MKGTKKKRMVIKKVGRWGRIENINCLNITAVSKNKHVDKILIVVLCVSFNIFVLLYRPLLSKYLPVVRFSLIVR